MIHQLLDVLAGADWHPEPGWDWQRFAEACDHHQVAPFVYCRLNRLPPGAVPPELLAHLRRRFYRISSGNYLLANYVVDWTQRLEAAQIPVLVYKGPAAALTAYGDLALREYLDLDLLIRPEHLTGAHEVLARIGFRIPPGPGSEPDSPRRRREFHHDGFLAPDQSHVLELHWQLGGNLWQSFGPDTGRFWERTEIVQLPRGRVATMCREDLFLALCFHGAKHRWWCLKWLLDVAEMLRTAEGWDWGRIEEMLADRPGARASASLGVLLARELLGVEAPAAAGRVLPVSARIRAVGDAIREEILTRGHCEDDPHRTLLGLEERRWARVRYRCALWFRVNVRINERDRAALRLPGWLGFLYGLVRPVRLIVKYGGQALRGKGQAGKQAGRPTPLTSSRRS